MIAHKKLYMKKAVIKFEITDITW